MPTDRAKIEDHPPAISFHGRPDSLRGEKFVLEIDRDTRVPRVWSDFIKIVAIIIGRIVDQYITTTQQALKLRHRFGKALAIRDILKSEHGGMAPLCQSLV